jgi:hypothetical protein
MNRRNAAFAAIAVAIVLAVVGASVAAVASGGRALAYSVNDTRVSQQNFDDLLDEFSNTPSTAQSSDHPGSINSTAVANVMTIFILRDLLRDTAERRGINITDADRKTGDDAAASQVQNLSQLPKSYETLVVDFFTYATALGLDGDALNALLAQQARAADIYVNPRYGTWHPRRAAVCPPTGCEVVSPTDGG